MLVQDQGGGGALSGHVPLRETLEKIRKELKLSCADWCVHLHVSQRDYARIVAGRKELSAYSLLRLAETLDLNPTLIEMGRIDFTALTRARKGDTSYINPMYTVAASSRKFTVVNTLDFVAKHRGLHLRTTVNRQFQVREDFWADWQDENSQLINIRFLTDLWKLLRIHGFGDTDFRALGFHSSITLRSTQLGRALGALPGEKDLYDCLFSEMISRMEDNHRYRIVELTPDRCVIESRSNILVAEALKLAETGSIEGCQVKIGIIAAMTTLIGKPAASVHETHCVHRGDPCCRFVADYSQFRHSEKAQQPHRLTLLP